MIANAPIEALLPQDKMPEAEVTLRLAMAVIIGGHTNNDVLTAIDGAQVKTMNTVHFPIVEFLNGLGWWGDGARNRWQCTYHHENYSAEIVVHSSAGEGDLVAELSNGCKLRVESKKGSLVGSKSSNEYPLIREAIGQLMTIEKADPSDVLAVAVPHSDKFSALATKWRQAPLMVSASIHIAAIDRSGVVTGLEGVGIS